MCDIEQCVSATAQLELRQSAFCLGLIALAVAEEQLDVLAAGVTAWTHEDASNRRRDAGFLRRHCT